MKIRDILKKKAVWITLTAVFVLAALFGLSVLLRYCNVDDRELTVRLEGNGDHANNFYTSKNTVDYSDGRFAWRHDGAFVSTLTVVDAEGNHKRFFGFGSPFRLMGDRVVYIDNSEERWLSLLDTKTERVTKIARNASSFTVFEKRIVFDIHKTITVGFGENTDTSWDESLFVYDTETKTTKKLLDSADEFFVYQDELYAVTDLHKTVVKVDWQDALVTTVYQTEEDYSMRGVIPAGKHLLCKGFEEDLLVCDRETEQNIALTFGGDERYEGELSYVFDGEAIYVSVQRYIWDYVFSRNVDHEDNGLWRVDPETLEYEKVLSDVFWELYLVDGMLFGRKDDQIYRIDTQTFETEALLG